MELFIRKIHFNSLLFVGFYLYLKLNVIILDLENKKYHIVTIAQVLTFYGRGFDVEIRLFFNTIFVHKMKEYVTWSA